MTTTTIHGSYQPHCYACTIDISGRGQKRTKQLYRWMLYEEMVEWIETLPVGAIIYHSTMAREVFNGGPDNWHVSYLVLRDMMFHGILRGVRRGPNVRWYEKVM